MTDALNKTISVPVGTDTFEFRLPTIMDEIRIGVRMRDIRRAAIGPVGDVSDIGIDSMTHYSTSAAATLEILLVASSATWPFSEGPDKKPVVDATKFPVENTGDVIDAYTAYLEGVSTFRKKGPPDPGSLTQKVVAG